jgi:peptidoglycan LD-endopeptidase LytH
MSRWQGWRKWAGATVVAAAALGALALPPLRHPLALCELLLIAEPQSLTVPVDGVRQRQIADTWGGPRGGGRRHRGVDIFASRGTPVRSTTPGIVARVGVVALGGNAVSIVGPRLTAHYYAHLDRFGAFKPGDRIAAGDVVGYVGDSGNAKGTPCHLHYGVYRALLWPVDPWPLLGDRRNPGERPATSR